MAFSERLKTARRQAKITKRGLARLMAGKDATAGQIDGFRSALVKYEKDTRTPNELTVLLLKQLLPNLQVDEEELEAERVRRRLESPAYKRLEARAGKLENDEP